MPVVQKRSRFVEAGKSFLDDKGPFWRDREAVVQERDRGWHEAIDVVRKRDRFLDDARSLLDERDPFWQNRRSVLDDADPFLDDGDPFLDDAISFLDDATSERAPTVKNGGNC